MPLKRLSWSTPTRRFPAGPITLEEFESLCFLRTTLIIQSLEENICFHGRGKLEAKS